MVDHVMTPFLHSMGVFFFGEGNGSVTLSSGSTQWRHSSALSGWSIGNDGRFCAVGSCDLDNNRVSGKFDNALMGYRLTEISSILSF
jgi:hypothetical protein